VGEPFLDLTMPRDGNTLGSATKNVMRTFCANEGESRRLELADEVAALQAGKRTKSFSTRAPGGTGSRRNPNW
jgi:hypothetical protein